MSDRKTVSVMIPCYNEEENAEAIYTAVRDELLKLKDKYDYEILFIDNKSTDNTRNIIRELCREDPKVKAIFNIKNFGQFNSPYYGLTQSDGDCTIPLCADFQDPIELIPDMVHKWEEGHKVICMIKSRSKENKLIYLLRSIYYWLVHKMGNVKQIKQFTGFGLYDRSFIDILRRLDDPTPFYRGIVAEYAPDHLEIEYEQQKRRAGKSSNNFMTLFDAAMLSLTSYTKGILRVATFGGFIMAILSLVVAIVYLVMKLTRWYDFPVGQAPMVIGVYFIGSVQLFFLGFLGEYVMSINQRVIDRPLVIEEERINFDP